MNIRRRLGKKQGGRVKPPEPGGILPVQLPPVQRARLENGLEIRLVESHSLPLLVFLFVLDAGTERDDAARGGLASLAVGSLDAGARGLTRAGIAGRLDRTGAVYEAHALVDAGILSLTTLTKHAEEGLEVVAGMLMSPTFPAKEFSRRRREQLASLLQQADRPATAATLAFNRLVYGSAHPYGRNPLGTETSLLHMRRTDASEFTASRCRPDLTTAIVVGDFAFPDLTRLMQRHFAGWEASPGPRSETPWTTSPSAGGLYVFDKPGAPQSEIRIGRPGLPRRSDDLHAATVMNRILGGQFASRLNSNLRERRGMTYGVYSNFRFYKEAGPFMISTAVAAEGTAIAVREILHEMRRMREEPVTRGELESAQRGISGGFALGLETPAQIATALQLLATYALPDDYFSEYPEKIGRVTQEDVRRVAESSLDGPEMTTVVVGDARTILAGLERLGLGPVQVNGMRAAS